MSVSKWIKNYSCTYMVALVVSPLTATDSHRSKRDDAKYSKKRGRKLKSKQ